MQIIKWGIYVLLCIFGKFGFIWINGLWLNSLLCVILQMQLNHEPVILVKQNFPKIVNWTNMRFGFFYFFSRKFEYKILWFCFTKSLNLCPLFLPNLLYVLLCNVFFSKWNQCCCVFSKRKILRKLVHELTIKGHLSTQWNIELLYNREVIFTIFSGRVLFDVAPTDVFTFFGTWTLYGCSFFIYNYKTEPCFKRSWLNKPTTPSSTLQSHRTRLRPVLL
jgi:hypothetical protein